MNPKKVLALIRFKLNFVAKASVRIQSLIKLRNFLKPSMTLFGKNNKSFCALCLLKSQLH